MKWKEWLSIPANRDAWNARRRERRSKKRKPAKHYLKYLKENKAKTKQRKKLKIEERRLFRVALNKAVDKIDVMRNTRAHRLKMQRMSYKQRCLLVIDYYYQLVRENKPILQVA